MINSSVTKVKRQEIHLNKSVNVNVKSNNYRIETKDDAPAEQNYEIDNNIYNTDNKTNSVVSNYVISPIRVMSDVEKEAYEKYKELASKYPKDNIEVRNAKLNWKIKGAGYGTREGVVAAALYFAEEEKNYVPYLWGGKANFVGLKENWGKNRRVVADYLNSNDQPAGSKPLDGIDCSGYVTWAILNGGYKCQNNSGDIISYSETYATQLPGVKKYSINKDTFDKKDKNGDYLIKAGDLLYRNNHIAMIVSINREKNMIIVAEQRGYALKDEKGKYIYDQDSVGANGVKSRKLKGMEVTAINIDDFINGKYVKDSDHHKFEAILSMEDYYSDSKNKISN